MKKLLFLGTILLCTASAFANEKNKKNEETNQPRTLVCKTVSAVDEDGEIVASASCCRSLLVAPTATEAAQLNIELTICADNKLEDTLNGN